MGDTLQLRFRHQAGDLGPFPFPDTTSIQEVKEKVLAAWPTEGPFTSEAPPSSAADLRFILSGKFLEAGRPLRDYRRDMGDLGDVVTMHMLVRAPGSTSSGKGGSGGGGKGAGAGAAPAAGIAGEPKGCGCAIS